MNQEPTVHRLLSEVAEAEVPAGSLNLADRMRRQSIIAQPERPSRRMKLMGTALVAASVLAALVGGRLLPGQAPSVSAAEALRRVEQTSAFGISGISSLHGTSETHAPGSDTIVRDEVWLELPSRLRREVIWPPYDNHGADRQTELRLGDEAWIWSGPESQPGVIDGPIMRMDPAEINGNLHLIPNPSASLDTPGESAGLCAQPGDKLELLGEEPVIGRDTLVIECVTGPQDVFEQPGTRLKLWVDKQLFLVLKYEHYDTTGELFIESRYTSLEVDQPIPAERLTFAPPAGTPIEDAPKAEEGEKR
ncbi:MAG TPA: hypothetical protein VGE07_22505 [Herpetosiphonaceae bacterium]